MTNLIKPEQLTLYFSPYCPYCHRVLNAMAELNLNPNLATVDAGGIILKNTISDNEAAKTLKAGGGKSTVPCLRIQYDNHIQWLYESMDIIDFLRKNLKT
ncbi:MAG: glutathione S-transferase N-terminal domain-containing protein [Ostreibacterium sp.]